MKIVVAVKQVASLDDEFELLEDRSGVDPDSLQLEPNEWDAYALEAALQLGEQAQDEHSEVVVISVGDQEADELLLGCLAKGADRALRIWADNCQRADPLTVARILAAAVDRESPDLVLCGVQSSDSSYGATGVALAGLLGLPHAAVIRHLTYEQSECVLTITRELECGLAEVLRVRMPALLTIQTGINEPRYATLRAIKQARDKPLETVTPQELGLGDAELSAVAGSRRLSLAPPDRGPGAQMLEGSPDQVARQIIDLVRERVS